MKSKLLTSVFIITAALFGISHTVAAQDIGAGARHSFALCNDGTLNAWGDNDDGELGIGITNMRSELPKTVQGLTDIIAVAGGEDFSIALKSDGTVWTWGNNSDGQLGNGTTIGSNIPAQVAGLSGITAIDASRKYAIALKNDGTVWTWGDNDYGQLGNGSTMDSKTPIQVPGIIDGIHIAAGKLHVLVLKNDGNIYSWGGNNFGQLGNGTDGGSTGTSIPLPLLAMSGFIGIAAGDDHSLAIYYDGTVWAWGYNAFGQLGNGSSPNNINLPVQVSGLTGIVRIDGGGYSSIALKNDGTVYTWGRNDYGQLGNGTTTDSNIPVLVSPLSGIISVEEGGVHSLARKNDGTVWAWGLNNYGELGTGNSTDSHIPVQVMSLCTTPSAIRTLSEPIISISPNPSDGIFLLTLDDMQLSKGSLEVYNVLGEKVYATNQLQAQMRLDLSGFAKGLYVLKVNNGIKSSTKRIVLQ